LLLYLISQNLALPTHYSEVLGLAGGHTAICQYEHNTFGQVGEIP